MGGPDSCSNRRSGAGRPGASTDASEAPGTFLTTKDGDGSVTTVLVLVILAMIWAAVLLPPYLQNRRESRPGDSIASFRNQLSVLERTTPDGRSRALGRLEAGRQEADRRLVAGYAPRQVSAATMNRAALGHRAPSQAAMRRAEARRRRRDVFLTLLGAVGVTFLLAVAMGGMVWMLHLAIDVAFVGYVALLVKLQQASAEKELKVRYLAPSPRRVPEPQLLLRRSGS